MRIVVENNVFETFLKIIQQDNMEVYDRILKEYGLYREGSTIPTIDFVRIYTVRAENLFKKGFLDQYNSLEKTIKTILKQKAENVRIFEITFSDSTYLVFIDEDHLTVLGIFKTEKNDLDSTIKLNSRYFSTGYETFTYPFSKVKLRNDIHGVKTSINLIDLVESDAEDVYMAMKIFIKCPSCFRLHVYWDGLTTSQQYIL